MNTGPQALLKRAVGAFDFANMRVGRKDIHINRTEVVMDALKFAIGVDVANLKVARFVDVDGVGCFTENGVVGAVGDPKTNVPGDGAEKRKALHEEEIDVVHDFPIEFDDGRREGSGCEGRYSRS